MSRSRWIALGVVALALGLILWWRPRSPAPAPADAGWVLDASAGDAGEVDSGAADAEVQDSLPDAPRSGRRMPPDGGHPGTTAGEDAHAEDGEDARTGNNAHTPEDARAADDALATAPAAPPTPDAGVALQPSLRVPDLGPYRVAVRDAIAAQMRYPREARRLRVEGTVEVRVRIAPGGALAEPPAIAVSSGQQSLDGEAVRMAEAAAPFAPLPRGFDAAFLEVVVPIRFRLAR